MGGAHSIKLHRACFLCIRRWRSALLGYTSLRAAASLVGAAAIEAHRTGRPPAMSQRSPTATHRPADACRSKHSLGLVRVDQSDPLAAGTADAQRQLGGHHLGASGPIFNAGIGTSGFTRGGAFAERRQQRIALVATKNTRRPCKMPAENSRTEILTARWCAPRPPVRPCEAPPGRVGAIFGGASSGGVSLSRLAALHGSPGAGGLPQTSQAWAGTGTHAHRSRSSVGGSSGHSDSTR